MRPWCCTDVACGAVDKVRSFWGWGFDDEGLGPDEMRSLAGRVGTFFKIDEVPLDPPVASQLELRASRIVAPAALAPWCSTSDVTRAGHTYGKSFRDIVRGLEREWPRPPDVVAYPRDEADVVSVLDWANEIDAIVIPYGGGSSVAGGVESPHDDDRPVISCDMSGLDRVLEIDRVSRAALIQGGAFGPTIEDQLRPHALTLRHYPQSFEVSSLGGWIATRSGGHFATMQTHIDDFVESLRAVTPAGVVESRRLPGSGAGPSPDHLLLGSEGILGIITSAWMRLQDRPRHRASGVARFVSFEAGARAARAIAQSGLWPSNCRLLDAGEAMMTGAGSGDAHLLLIGFESADHPVDVSMQRAAELVHDHGGAVDVRSDRSPHGDVDATDQWRSAFLRAPYTRDGLVRLGLISETFESAITWDRFDTFVFDVKAAVESALKSVGAWPAVVTCRLTHVYPDGAAPYFTILAPGDKSRRVAQWDEVKHAAMMAINDGGGTVTHHHSVGRDHRAGYDLERPDLFAAQLRAAKRVVDPRAILNPGVLIDP